LLSEIVQTIVAEYDVSDDQSAADLLALVADLERNGLITVN